MSLAIVTTTINVPTLLEGYCEDIRRHDHRDVTIIVIGDNKTPAETGPYCETLERRYAIPIEYYGVESQRRYLKAFPELDKHLPYDSVQRRNAGMVRAYQLGVDVVLTVDDDNYVLEPDLLRCHSRVGTEVSLPAYWSSTGWFNPCQFLSADGVKSFYHRGFPLGQRWKPSEVENRTRQGKLVTNVGLWIGDPDVDAWLRLSFPLECTRWNASGSFALGEGTWAPFNSQQTAVARELLPAYFLDPNAGRYDDIWASYITHRLAQHFGHLVSYGSPIVRHEQKRSLQSLWRDLDDERHGAALTDDFAVFLREATFQGSSYAECYSELADQLGARLGEVSPPDQAAYLGTYVEGMRVWQDTFARLKA